uniref:Uncharacterized protein n=1 Tax=Dasya binghamiae TaxID=1896963 RepID=A0A1C8XS91_9FLOR|nr:hypothetical protein BI108_pgp048 [Dasya binghamiae]AOH77359.1 hypothetical protein [Dasya binghamiae]
MKFNFDKNYDNESLNNEFLATDEDNNNLDKPIGWSSICFNETISYYTDCNTKIIDKHDE